MDAIDGALGKGSDRAGRTMDPLSSERVEQAAEPSYSSSTAADMHMPDVVSVDDRAPEGERDAPSILHAEAEGSMDQLS
jgi:hypothetical protein